MEVSIRLMAVRRSDVYPPFTLLFVTTVYLFFFPLVGRQGVPRPTAVWYVIVVDVIRGSVANPGVADGTVDGDDRKEG